MKKKFILSEHVSGDRSQFSSCIRTDRHKLISFWRTNGEQEYEMYDLQEDPLEQNDIANESSAKGIKEDLKDLLIGKLLATSTPPFTSWLSKLPAAIK